MRITTKAVWNIETNQQMYWEGFDWQGPVAHCLGGASSADKSAASEDAQFAQSLTNEQAITFAEQQDALNAVTAAMTPILAGGEYQYGFSTAEDAALQGNIESQGAQATANSVGAQQLRNQQMSGGANVMPTGAQEALEGAQRELGAQSTAQELSNEKIAGYEQGNKNFENAASSLENVAYIENPTGVAGAANNANQNTISANKAVDAANANSLGSKLLGGAISTGLNLATSGISSLMQRGGGSKNMQWAQNNALPTSGGPTVNFNALQPGAEPQP